MTIYASNYRDRLDISYILYHTQRPLVSTRVAKYIHADILPCGENAIVALACYTGMNIEDSIIFNQTSVERGLFRSTSLKKWMSKIEKNQSTSQDDMFMKPDPTKLTGSRQAIYDKLNDKGYIPEETVIENGDVLIGKVTPIQPVPGSNKCFKDSSEIYKAREPAIVDKVFTGIYDSEGYGMIKVRTRSERIPKMGDKFCLDVSKFEVLTNRGWLHLDKITMEDKIATLVDGDKLVYDHPIGIYKFKYTGTMYKVRSESVELDVTIDHNMYVKLENKDDYELITAGNIVGQKYNFKKDCNYDIPDFSFEKNGKIYDSDLLFEFVGLYYKYSIRQNYNENKKNVRFIKIDTYGDYLTVCDNDIINRIIKICESLDLSYDNSEDYILFVDFQDYLDLIIDKYDNLSELTLNLNQKQSRLILDGIIDENNQLKDTFFDFNNINILAIHAGYSTILMNNDDIKIIKDVNLNRPLNEYDETYEYEGYVGCVEVPSHVFMVRQNNKNVWIGNCSRHGLVYYF